MSIPRQWVVWAALVMLPACRTGLKRGDAGAPADSSDGSSEVAPANLCGDVAQVTAGLLHVCALKGDGTVWCWGANGYGQLGDATLVDKAAPVPVTALGSDVVQVTAGDNATCALKHDGTLWCWGANRSGQLGNGTTTDSSTPTQVVALGSTVAEVAAGSFTYLICARKLDRTLWCWGFGFFGDGTGPNGHSTPTQVAALGSDVADVSIGQNHLCARKIDSSLWCWGWNAAGQLGDGSLIDRPTPVEVTALGHAVSSVSAGEQATCALKTDGTLWCWGHGGPTPTQVASLGADVVQVSVGQGHTCARKGDGTLWCWGGNGAGQLGDGSTRSRDTPVQVAAATGFLQVAAGFELTCAVQVGATLSCWGTNGFGQLGVGTTSIQAVPLAVPSLGTDVAQLAAGDSFFCAGKTDGSAWCWGNNLAGLPDDGLTGYRPSPVEVVALGHSVAQVAGGGAATCALMTDGGVWCWGNISNTAGNFDARPVPFQIAGLPTNIVEVAVGWGHACARADDGTLWCWGRNDNGQLGDGSNAFFREMPVQVSALAGLVVQVATTGGNHTCARASDGALWCWGANDSGQLGDGTTTDSATPLQVTPLGANVRQVSTSPVGHTCACLADGTAWCWGRNDSGQLGDGTTSQSAFPVQVSGLASVVEISAGGVHTCARTRDGALWCWGDNAGGELGNGMSGQRAMATTPVRVARLGTNVVEVCAGTGRTCARGKNGGIWCWGARDYGMMGDGDLGFTLSPVAPMGCH